MLIELELGMLIRDLHIFVSITNANNNPSSWFSFSPTTRENIDEGYVSGCRSRTAPIPMGVRGMKGVKRTYSTSDTWKLQTRERGFLEEKKSQRRYIFTVISYRIYSL